MRSTLEKLGRFELCFGLGPPDVITVHLDVQICTERQAVVIEALGAPAARAGIALANAIIVTRRLIRVAWTTHRP